MHLLMAAATLALALWLAWYLATRPDRPDREERRRARSIRAHARDLATGPPQLADLSHVRDLEETTVAIGREDLRALFARQDREVGDAYVRDLEARLAASFALVELTQPTPTLTPGAAR
jgi:hypothetical protein